MMVRGDELACVHTVGAAMPNGAKWETPIACIYKFKGPKTQRHKLHFDRRIEKTGSTLVSPSGRNPNRIKS